MCVSWAGSSFSVCLSRGSLLIRHQKAPLQVAWPVFVLMGMGIATIAAVAQNTEEKISLKDRLCEPISLSTAFLTLTGITEGMPPEAPA